MRGQTASLHALVEYVKGGSLEQPDWQWPRTRVGQAEYQLGWMWPRESTTCHSQGIFHRDLTSKNVLIRTYGENDIQALVADFGLAAKIPPKLEKLPQVGSPYWMSPECLRGERYDQTSDVFSYGICLCELIARTKADPDFLPRTTNFGVDYLAFSDLVAADCPSEFLQLAFSCVTVRFS